MNKRETNTECLVPATFCHHFSHAGMVSCQLRWPCQLRLFLLRSFREQRRHAPQFPFVWLPSTLLHQQQYWQQMEEEQEVAHHHQPREQVELQLMMAVVDLELHVQALRPHLDLRLGLLVAQRIVVHVAQRRD